MLAFLACACKGLEDVLKNQIVESYMSDPFSVETSSSLIE